MVYSSMYLNLYPTVLIWCFCIYIHFHFIQTILQPPLNSESWSIYNYFAVFLFARKTVVFNEEPFGFSVTKAKVGPGKAKIFTDSL